MARVELLYNSIIALGCSNYLLSETKNIRFVPILQEQDLVTHIIYFCKGLGIAKIEKQHKKYTGF
jgi:hypothetical protein